MVGQLTGGRAGGSGAGGLFFGLFRGGATEKVGPKVPHSAEFLNFQGCVNRGKGLVLGLGWTGWRPVTFYIKSRSLR